MTCLKKRGRRGGEGGRRNIFTAILSHNKGMERSHFLPTKGAPSEK
jgi:hypothetical protein